VSVEPALAGRMDALNVFVDLLSEVDAPTPSSVFWDRLCQAGCQLAAMERAVLFIYDDTLHRVRAAGSYGVDPALVDLDVTLEEAPIAKRALAEDQVVEVSEKIEEWVPARYARFFGLTTLTCTPLSAGGHWFGVICADRGGGRFRLTGAERHTMWTLGKLAALGASAAVATAQQERARSLSGRIDLAREIHERVMQRLFGVALVLGGDRDLSGEERARCQAEVQTALSELRTALTRPLAVEPPDTRATVREELERLARRWAQPPLVVRWGEDAVVPAELEPLAVSVAGEALRNVRKHAQPTRVEVRVDSSDGVFVLEVLNDGVRDATPGTGMGLRLAAFEALQRGGVLEFGAPGPGRWHVRLVVPRSAE
jgi:signal transduction histidine kinase